MSTLKNIFLELLAHRFEMLFVVSSKSENKYYVFSSLIFQKTVVTFF